MISDPEPAHFSMPEHAGMVAESLSGDRKRKFMLLLTAIRDEARNLVATGTERLGEDYYEVADIKRGDEALEALFAFFTLKPDNRHAVDGYYCMLDIFYRFPHFLESSLHLYLVECLLTPIGDADSDWIEESLSDLRPMGLEAVLPTAALAWHSTQALSSNESASDRLPVALSSTRAERLAIAEASTPSERYLMATEYHPLEPDTIVQEGFVTWTNDVRDQSLDRLPAEVLQRIVHCLYRDETATYDDFIHLSRVNWLFNRLSARPFFLKHGVIDERDIYQATAKGAYVRLGAKPSVIFFTNMPEKHYTYSSLYTRPVSVSLIIKDGSDLNAARRAINRISKFVITFPKKWRGEIRGEALVASQRYIRDVRRFLTLPAIVASEACHDLVQKVYVEDARMLHDSAAFPINTLHLADWRHTQRASFAVPQRLFNLPYLPAVLPPNVRHIILDEADLLQLPDDTDPSRAQLHSLHFYMITMGYGERLLPSFLDIIIQNPTQRTKTFTTGTTLVLEPFEPSRSGSSERLVHLMLSHADAPSTRSANDKWTYVHVTLRNDHVLRLKLANPHSISL